MQIQIFVLCDKFAMGKTPDGQMVWSLIGPFDTKKFPHFPAQIKFTVVAALRFMAEEHGGHQIEISLIDADSRPILAPPTKQPIGIVRRITVPDTNKSHCHFEVWSVGHPETVANPGGAWIEKPGEYFFDLRVDGNYLGRLPVRVLNTA